MDIGTLTGHIQLEDQLSSQLSVLTYRVQQFADSFDGMVGVVLGGSIVIVGAIGAMIGAIVTLGMKGSTILGVEQAFDTFAQTVGSTGATMFNALNEGLRGTVDSMQLMQSTTKLLSSGIKVSAADMNVMAKTAREMAKATGTDAATSLSQLSTAVQQGNTRMLRRIGITVDLVKAEKDFAASIGTTREQLNQAGIQQARANAIMQAFRDRLEKTGESALSFKEQIQQANVAMGNWFDDLSKGVAKSFAVSNAFATIKDSFTETFGGTAQTLQESILRWIDDFANAVARVGPIVIQAFGTIKNWVVQVWNELAAFNDRYQITNNLISGAKFAWNALQFAFQLVKTAVQEVIAAWQSMPEWLQRITQTALTASLAVGAFSVGVAGVAAPVAALVSKLDLVINIFGNLSGAIFSTFGLLDRFGIAAKTSAAATTASTAATYGWVTALSVFHTTSTRATAVTTGLTFATAAQANVYNAVATAAAFWQTIVVTLTARLAMLSVVTTSATAINKVVTASYGAMAAAMTYVNSTALVMGVRMTLAGITTTVAGRAAGVAGVAWLGLGTAILAVQYALIPLAIIWGAWEFGKWIAGFDSVKKGLLSVLQYLPLVGEQARRAKQAMDEFRVSAAEWEEIKPSAGWRSFDPIVAALEDRMVAVGKQAGMTSDQIDQFVRTSVERLRDLKDNGTSAVGALSAQLMALQSVSGIAPQVFSRMADEARRLEKEGAKLPDNLKQLITLLPAVGLAATQTGDGFIKGSTAAEDFSKKIADLKKSFANVASGFTDDAAFTKAFEGLSPSQRANPEVQAQLVPNIDKLIAGHKDLVSGMQDVRFATQQAQIALAAKDKVVLEAYNLTLSQIDGLKRLGLSETEIAGNYDVSTAALQKRIAVLQEAAQLEQNNQSFMAAYLAQEEKARERITQEQLAGNRAVQSAKEKLDDYVMQSTASTTDYQIKQIRERATAEMVAMASTKATEKQKQEFYTLTADLAEKQISRIGVNYDQMVAVSKRTLFDQAARARETYERMARDPENYSKKTIEQFRKIADAAEREFLGIKTMSEKVYSAMGDVAEILDAIPGKFAEIGAMAARAGQAIMENLAEGDWIGALIAGATAAVGIFTKLFGGVSKEVQEARDEVDKFGEGLSNTLTEAQKLEAGGVKWKETVIAVRDAYLLVGKTVSEAERVVTALWDTSNPARSLAARKEIEINMALAKNVTAVRSLVQEYLGAGRTIPAALQAGIDKLVRMGQLTAENATAILGLQQTSVPAFADVQAAAERYGIVVETLGNQVQGLKITEIANQVVSDWELMELAGADMNVVMEGMQDEILELITNAQKFGTALPAAMKPIIERMDTAGYFTDEFGNKLVDVSQLTFAETLEEKIQRIVDAMILLADVITDKVGGALDNIGNKTVSPRIAPRYEGPSQPSEPSETEDPIYAAGGRAAARVINFSPRGSDTIPAMITPGEKIVPRHEADQQAGGGTAIIEVEGRTLATVLVPSMRKEVKRYKLARR